jgi:hypothetical protein
MKTYVSNAFSLSMLDRKAQAVGRSKWLRMPRPATLAQVLNKLSHSEEIVSCVGHADTASMLSGLLGVDLPMNRISVKLEKTDTLIVGQYVGPRLPEGTTTMPEGATIDWWII